MNRTPLLRTTLVTVCLIGVVVLGCAPEPVPVALKPLPVTRFLAACRGIGLEANLVGDPADPRSAWLQRADGTRIDLVWPPGYAARFNPSLEVLDAAGRVVFRGGNKVSGGCTQGPADAPSSIVLIQPTDVIDAGAAPTG